MTSHVPIVIPDRLGNEIPAIEFARAVLEKRWIAVGLNVEQIRELAATILVLDNRLAEATQLIIAMTASGIGDDSDELRKISPEELKQIGMVTKYVVEDKQPKAAETIARFLKAHEYLEEVRFSQEENLALQKFEKAAIAMAGIYKPRG